MLLACWPRALRVTRAISRSKSGISVSGWLYSAMESHQPRQRHPHPSGNQSNQQQRQHYPSHPQSAGLQYPPHNQQQRPPHNHRYHGQQQDFPPPPPFPPVRSPSFLGPMAMSSSDFQHGRPNSGARDRPSAHHHIPSMWSHQPHSAPPLPQQEHAPNPQHPLTPHHHQHQLHWGFPPPDDRWAMHPSSFSGPPPPHFPPLPPGPGLPMDPGMMQQDGRLSGKFNAPGNYKASSDVFQQQSRNFSGTPGHPRENWHKMSGSKWGQKLQQNGYGGQAYDGMDKGLMEKTGEGKMYKKHKRQTSPSRSPRCHAPLRPMVEVNKALKLKHTSTLSVLSYNLLAQDLLEKNMSLYERRHPDHLHWDFRKEGLIKELKQSTADILCLQEVQQDHYHDWFLPELSRHNYCGVFVQRTGDHLDGCALFYKQSKLRLVDWTGLKYKKNFKVLNRDNVALLAKLQLIQDKEGGDTSFCVANTHLLFNPKAGEVKLAQLAYLFAELHKLASNSGSEDPVPVLLCGDLNSTPHSPLVNFISSSILDYSNLSAVVIAGYFDNSKKSRTIPKPLFPPDMLIGSNCVYVAGGEQERNSNRTKLQSNETTSSARIQDGVKDGEEARQPVEPKITVVPGDGVLRTQSENHSEFREEKVEGQPSLRVTRSARGRRGMGHSSRYNGVLDIPGVDSLLQANLSPSSTAVKRSRDQLSADDMKSSKSASSGASSVDDMAVETRSRTDLDDNASTALRQDCQSRSSSTTEDSLTERQHHHHHHHHHDEAGYSGKYSKALESNTAGGCGAGEKPNNNNHNNTAVVLTANGKTMGSTQNGKLGQLTHPFKLSAAYPHPSQCRPSTVTTYHEAAFETVDYIFFSPMAYRVTSSGKKQLCGFHLLQRQVLPSTHTLLDLGPQPHRYLSSDHLLLKATFQFTW